MGFAGVDGGFEDGVGGDDVFDGAEGCQVLAGDEMDEALVLGGEVVDAVDEVAVLGLEVVVLGVEEVEVRFLVLDFWLVFEGGWW